MERILLQLKLLNPRCLSAIENGLTRAGSNGETNVTWI
jgi:hypothetical protein